MSFSHVLEGVRVLLSESYKNRFLIHISGPGFAGLFDIMISDSAGTTSSHNLLSRASEHDTESMEGGTAAELGVGGMAAARCLMIAIAECCIMVAVKG